MTEAKGKTRLLSLDVFRGLTIAGMVLVNNPGSWSAIYAPLKHAEWHGITPTDFIFPFFVFIVGIAIPFALGSRRESTETGKIYLKIIRRAAIIFALGLFLALFPAFDFANLRIPGVLQRIAVCYLIVSIFYLHTNWRQQVYTGAGLLLFYWLAMTMVPVPGCETTSIDDQACNLAAYLDRAVFGANHIYKAAKVFDPEGIFSTVPALVTALSGVLTGTWLKSDRSDADKVGGIFFFGVSAVAAGWVWSWIFPFNKALWTSSYVVYTSGLALCVLGFCYWLVDIKNYTKWAKPFIIFGVNALALYVFSGLTARIMNVIKVSDSGGAPISLQKWIFDAFFAPLASPVNASLMYAVAYIFFWLFLMWLLYRKRIYIKV